MVKVRLMPRDLKLLCWTVWKRTDAIRRNKSHIPNTNAHNAITKMKRIQQFIAANPPSQDKFTNANNMLHHIQPDGSLLIEIQYEEWQRKPSHSIQRIAVHKVEHNTENDKHTNMVNVKAHKPNNISDSSFTLLDSSSSDNSSKNNIYNRQRQC